MSKTTRNDRVSKLLRQPLPMAPPAVPEAFEDLRAHSDGCDQ